MGMFPSKIQPMDRVEIKSLKSNNYVEGLLSLLNLGVKENNF